MIITNGKDEVFSPGMDIRLLDLTQKAANIISEGDQEIQRFFTGWTSNEINQFVEENF